MRAPTSASFFLNAKSVLLPTDVSWRRPMDEPLGYSDEFLGRLRQFEVPFEDLRECIIGQDIRQVNGDIADMWVEMIDMWRSGGMSEYDAVNLFFHVACSQLASLESDKLMDEVEDFLGGIDCG
jgi:hypothetical protein